MTQFRTEEIFQTLKGLLRVIDNDEKRKQIESYIDAAQAPVEKAMFDMLSHFAEAVDGQVSAHYRVNLSYKPGVLDLDVRATEPGEDEVEALTSMAEGDVEKITIRIPAELRELAQEAAARAGLSVNAWYVRMLARALRGSEQAQEPPREEGRRHRRHERHGMGQRLSGWVGPE
jgi:hypothetical protein